ncbi:BNR-4 repeat-containing protein [Hymenobacter sp.]|uniref:BNR-4 repeat-containing protein n=1 Tax=Hymenobacter sp. TaxID=1898978 RepID=UPI00286A99CC|nr:BNR-4 repeat-containing protein [Hymenobacter sp.]
MRYARRVARPMLLAGLLPVTLVWHDGENSAYAPKAPQRPAAGILAAAVGPLETVAAEIDASNVAGWWTPLDEYQGRTYCVFNAPGPTAADHQVRIGQRKAAGPWTSACLPASPACATYVDDLGHNQPSMAVDGDGYLHAFVSMHNNGWRYYRSATPGDITTMQNQSAEMPDPRDTYTYPVLTRTPSGDLYLLIRARINDGDGQGRLYRWNNAANAWTRVGVFARDAGYAVYPDDVKADAAGNLHIIYEWSKAPSGIIRHRAAYLRYHLATGKAYKADGRPLTLPVSIAASDEYQSFEGAETWTSDPDLTSPGVQSARLALVPNSNNLSVAYRYRTTHGGPYTVRRAYWNGRAWSRTTVYAGGDTNAAMGTTHDGRMVRIYYSKKGTFSTATVAESVGTAPFAETPLAAGKSIERLAVKMRPDGTDAVYLVAPTEVSPTTGKLYFQTVSRPAR